MKTAYDILKSHPDLLDHPAVQELVSQYEQTADALIDLQQVTGYSREAPLKVLVSELLESISKMRKHNEEADRFGYEDKMDYEKTVLDLEKYIYTYLRDYNIRL